LPPGRSDVPGGPGDPGWQPPSTRCRWRASISGKGNCWDNAVAEDVFATLKAEEITEPNVSKQDAHRRIASYINGFYNPPRMDTPKQQAKCLLVAFSGRRDGGRARLLPHGRQEMADPRT
jgi:transposase InsO family protein